MKEIIAKKVKYWQTQDKNAMKDWLSSNKRQDRISCK